MRGSETLERIRVAPNPYGVGLMRAFERNNPFAAALSDALQRECETGARALYLGLINAQGELLARARLVVDSLNVVLIDEIEATAGQNAALGELIRFAADEASRLQRPLVLMAAEDDTDDWGRLGFGDTGFRVLGL